MECHQCQSIFSHELLIVNGQSNGNSALDRYFKKNCPFPIKHCNNFTPLCTLSKVSTHQYILLIFANMYFREEESLLPVLSNLIKHLLNQFSL